MSSVHDIANKLKKLPQDRLAQVAVALLLIYIASILANLSYLMIPGSHNAANITAPNRAAQRQQPTAGVNVGALTSMNIFGSYVKPADQPKAPEPVVEQQEVPPTNLNLTLAATVAEDNNSGKGTAIIQSGSAQGTYGIDDKIEGTTAIVKLVYVDRIIIQNGMKRETLMLDGVEYDRMNVPRPVKGEGSDSKTTSLNSSNRLNDSRDKPGGGFSSSKAKQVDRRKDKALTNKLAEQKRDITRNPMKLYDLIRFSPVRKGGALAGYRLNPGKEPDLFKQAGFRPNDLAVEVNGTPLNDIQAAMQILRDFRELTEANIVVERDGIRTEILFSLDAGNSHINDGRNSKGRLQQR